MKFLIIKNGEVFETINGDDYDFQDRAHRFAFWDTVEEHIIACDADTVKILLKDDELFDEGEARLLLDPVRRMGLMIDIKWIQLTEKGVDALPPRRFYNEPESE